MFSLLRVLSTSLLLFISIFSAILANAAECDNWQTSHSEWIWCDGFEATTPLNSRYEDVSTTGMARSVSEAIEGNASLQQHYTTGQVNAGWVTKVMPQGFPDHMFYRWYHKFGNGYSSFPPKMARIGYRNRNNWQTVFMVHSWISGNNPDLDVVARNSSQGPWLPVAKSDFDLSQHADKWVSYEVEIKVNTPGNTDGLYRLWINDKLMIERTNVDLRGNTSDKINEVMLDTYWNGGATANLDRYYDNFVISTQKIGLIQSSNTISPPSPPTGLSATIAN